MLSNFLKFLLFLVPIVNGNKEISQKLRSSENSSKFDKEISGNNFKGELAYPTFYPSAIKNDNIDALQEKFTLARIQPQVLVYPNNFAPGQQFLLQPASPPNNFLIPQPAPGPEIFLRDIPNFFPTNGIPRPGAKAPPVEKDAEEIPTDQIGVHQPSPKQKDKRPEKLETFETDKKGVATEAEVLNEADKNNNKPILTNLKPGQSFFFLNGQTLFPSFGGFHSNYLDPFKLFEKDPLPQYPEKQTELRNQPSILFFDKDFLEHLHRPSYPVNIAQEKENNEKRTDQNPPLVYFDNSVLLNQPTKSENNNNRDVQNLTPTSSPSKQEIPNEEEKLAPPAFPINNYQFQPMLNKFSLLGGSDTEHVFGNNHYPGFYNLRNIQEPQNKESVKENIEENNAEEKKQSTEDSTQTISSKASNNSSSPDEQQGRINVSDSNEANNSTEKRQAISNEQNLKTLIGFRNVFSQPKFFLRKNADT